METIDQCLNSAFTAGYTSNGEYEINASINHFVDRLMAIDNDIPVYVAIESITMMVRTGNKVNNPYMIGHGNRKMALSSAMYILGKKYYNDWLERNR